MAKSKTKTYYQLFHGRIISKMAIASAAGSSCLLLLITSITTQKARVCTSTSWRLLQLRELENVLLAVVHLLNIYLFLAPTIYSR